MRRPVPGAVDAELEAPVESKHLATIVGVAFPSVAIFGIAVVVEICDLRKLEAHLDFLGGVDPDYLEAAAQSAAAYPGNDTIVDRIVAWGAALRRK